MSEACCLAHAFSQPQLFLHPVKAQQVTLSPELTYAGEKHIVGLLAAANILQGLVCEGETPAVRKYHSDLIWLCKALRPGVAGGADGSFRATFEDKPLLSDTIFLRAWWSFFAHPHTRHLVLHVTATCAAIISADVQCAIWVICGCERVLPAGPAAVESSIPSAIRLEL